MSYSCLERLGVGPDADERAIRRAYARELKKIDQEADPAGFQALREAYDEALAWLRYRTDEVGEEYAEAYEEAWQPAEVGRETVTAAASVAPDQAELYQPSLAPAMERTLEEEAVANADAVFAEFVERSKGIPARCAAHEESIWAQVLRNSLAEPRMVSIRARELFEVRVACLLADGWQLGHEYLLGAAAEVLGWNENRRLERLGRPGALLDAALSQKVIFDMQQHGEWEDQLKLLVRLRNPDLPSKRELLRHSRRLALMIARFPALLPLLTDIRNVQRWREMDSGVPEWQRKLVFTGANVAGGASAGFNRSPWLLFFAIWFIIKAFTFFGSGGSSAPYEDPSPYRKRGEQALLAGDYSDAVAQYTRAIKLQPRNADDYYERALAFEGTGQSSMALEDAKESITLYPDMGPGPYVLRARLLEAAGRHDAALAEARALELALHDRADGYISAARIYSNLHREQDAVAVLERGMAALPAVRSLAVHRAMRRGVLEAKAGDAAAAAADFRMAQDKATTYQDLNQMCWHLATNNVELKTALAACDAALEKNPKSAATRDSKGFTLLRMGRYGDAIRWYNAALEVRSDQAGSLFGRAVAKQRLGDQLGAEADLAAARKLAPEVETQFASYGVKI